MIETIGMSIHMLEILKKNKLNLHLLCAFNHQFGFNIKLDFYIIAIGNYGSELESN